MRGLLVVLLMSAAIVTVTACDAVRRAIGPRETTVRLVNDSEFDVDVTLFYDDEQDVIEDVLTEVGTQVDRVIGPGETFTFSRDCEDLQSIVIDDADLLVVVGLGPEDSTEVLRDGDEFGCGDTITFTFDHSDLVTDFRVTWFAL